MAFEFAVAIFALLVFAGSLAYTARFLSRI